MIRIFHYDYYSDLRALNECIFRNTNALSVISERQGNVLENKRIRILYSDNKTHDSKTIYLYFNSAVVYDSDERIWRDYNEFSTAQISMLDHARAIEAYCSNHYTCIDCEFDNNGECVLSMCDTPEAWYLSPETEFKFGDKVKYNDGDMIGIVIKTGKMLTVAWGDGEIEEINPFDNKLTVSNRIEK
jgi:hypothetical protein